MADKNASTSRVKLQRKTALLGIHQVRDSSWKTLFLDWHRNDYSQCGVVEKVKD